MAIKLIIFDLDGTLVSAKELHYKSLNAALSQVDQKYVISRDEHLANYDGLSTMQKLSLLNKTKGFPSDKSKEVWQAKQNITTQLISEEIKPDRRLEGVLVGLAEKGFILAVASNAIISTVNYMLESAQIRQYFEVILGNESVEFKKPNPAIFLKCMLAMGIAPGETLIVEDSPVGRRAAIQSGAHLLGVNSPEDVTLESILGRINKVEGNSEVWTDDSLTILVPMAGAGTRFQQAGFVLPKPLIEVLGKPMIQKVVESLNVKGNYIFIVQKEHYEKYNLKYILQLIAPGCRIIQVGGITDGAARTTLLAKEYINNDSPLLLANADQYIEWNSSEFMYSMDRADGGILTFPASHPKWSFARSVDGKVVEVAEKRPISTEGTVGVYYWKRGSDYVKYAEQMIAKNIRTNNEFYVCPVYNEAIQDGKTIKSYKVSKMYGLGTPDDLKEFLTLWT